MFQNKFSYLTHNHGHGGQQVLEISAPTGGASGYLQAHLAAQVGRGSHHEDMPLTDLSSKVRKMFRPKKRFSQIWFLGRKIFLCTKSHQYPNSNSPLFGPIVDKRVGSFARRYCQFGPVQKVSFFDLGPKYRLIPSGAIWTNVREK